MKQVFETAELERALKAALGFELELKRLDGASAVNFRAVRKSDGFTFLVKCSRLDEKTRADKLERHLLDLDGSKATKWIFRDEMREFAGCRVFCLSWCPGKRVFPDRLTERELADYLDDYLGFSAAMQRTSNVLGRYPSETWRREAVEALSRSAAGRYLARVMDREMKVGDCTFRDDRLKIVHGDFHYGNYHFEGGRVTGYFDLEEFRYGYPAEDIIRYFVCAVEHLRWYEQGRKRAILKAFRFAVKRLPYSEHEWNVAMNALFLRKMHKKFGRRVGLFQVINFLYRMRFYREMKRVCGEELRVKSEE